HKKIYLIGFDNYDNYCLHKIVIAANREECVKLISTNYKDFDAVFKVNFEGKWDHGGFYDYLEHCCLATNSTFSSKLMDLNHEIPKAFVKLWNVFNPDRRTDSREGMALARTAWNEKSDMDQKNW